MRDALSWHPGAGRVGRPFARRPHRDHMVTMSADTAEAHRIELAPNCSLTPHGARLFVGSLGAVTFGVAIFFATRGFWPVLPFAGLEIGLLAWAVRASMRRGTEREVIMVTDIEVVVERNAPSGSRRTVFPRHWARVTLRGPSRAQHPSRLSIESHGRTCEIGRFLTEDERLQLALRLGRLVGKSCESPMLAP